MESPNLCPSPPQAPGSGDDQSPSHSPSVTDISPLRQPSPRDPDDSDENDSEEEDNSDIIRLIASTRDLMRAKSESSSTETPVPALSEMIIEESTGAGDGGIVSPLGTMFSGLMTVTSTMAAVPNSIPSGSGNKKSPSPSLIQVEPKDDLQLDLAINPSPVEPIMKTTLAQSFSQPPVGTRPHSDEKPVIKPQTRSQVTSDYQMLGLGCDPGTRSSVAAFPEFPLNAGKMQGGAASTRKGKMGLPFFQKKPQSGMSGSSAAMSSMASSSSSSAPKAVYMKELKRMIRAGKPSFEQIHNWRNSFETLLNDRFGLALFKDFLSTEFSDENIEFWIACQQYKQITNPKKMAIRAQRIFNEFIAVQANREVNLDSTTRLQTEADLANPTIHTMDNAQKRIQALMEKDSYRRFLRSDVYMTLYSEAREVAKAAAVSALAASLQDASSELDGAVLNLVNAGSSASSSPFSFLSNFGNTFNTSSTGTGVNLTGVAAAAAKAEVGMNNVQDLQLLGLSTSRHMRASQQQQQNQQHQYHHHAPHPSANTASMQHSAARRSTSSCSTGAPEQVHHSDNDPAVIPGGDGGGSGSSPKPKTSPKMSND